MGDIQNVIDDIGQTATTMQNNASNPHLNVWVNASAGTGKTKVLTDRVLRLLMPEEGQAEGASPDNILCVTFTKAGANEMITRVMRTLSEWAVCTENKLYESLQNLLGHDPTRQQIDYARELFAKIIDTPEGLQITTIHGFCQSILGRFTIEAGLPPNFELIEDADTATIIRRIRDDIIRNGLEGRGDAEITQAFYNLSQNMNGPDIEKLFHAIVNDRDEIKNFVSQNPDFKTAIFKKLDVTVDATQESIFYDFFGDDVFPRDTIMHMAKALEHGSKGNQDYARMLYDICTSIDVRHDLIQKYRGYFLKKGDEISTHNKFTKAVIAFEPNYHDLFIEEAKRVQNYCDRLNSLYIAQSTFSLLTLAIVIIEQFEHLKTITQKIDYDDLITKTAQLLRSDMRDWVLYKMDNNIDHILLDEAQDTSPDQWAIIDALLDEFFSGETHRNTLDNNRTIFVVGDKKQSIFSFQGADPNEFDRMRLRIKSRVEEAQKRWMDIPMNTSFRSTSAILDITDNTFDSDDMKQAVAGSSDDYKNHLAYRQGQSGRVDLWPLYKAPKAEERPAWDLPIQEIDNFDSMAALANRIAETIADWCGNRMIPSKNRFVQAGDIMILLRRRNAMVDHLIRALKKHNVPVSGADRLVVSSHIAVQDIVAVMAFAMMPDDDLTLACVLKSPFIGWDDSDLEHIAHYRTGTLWHAIKEKADRDVVSWLQGLIENLSGMNAFMAVNYILTTRTPVQNYTGWQSLMTRLGQDCLDPLEELVTMAQGFDATHPATGIQGFINMIHNNESQIKRELEGENGQVRIMTVHASKGLQAPIVFIPDAVSVPTAGIKATDGFQWVDGYPLWVHKVDFYNDILKAHKDTKSAAAMDEYNRLLYVAMTRAEDHLIMCGALNKIQSKVNEKSWYASVEKGLNGMTHTRNNWVYDDTYMMDDESQSMVFETDDIVKQKARTKDDFEFKSQPLPQFVTQDLKTEQYPPRILKPSQGDDDVAPVRSPLGYVDDSYKFRRGLLTHSLLQYLPDIASENRMESGRRFLEKQAPDIKQDIKNNILDEVLNILSAPEFAPYFGAGSMAEVPITGVVSNDNGKVDIISGQIDRMVVSEDSVWIVDFKSNRPSPDNVADVPAIYKSQLKAYKTLISDIYPDKQIKCALLWTDTPCMMELEI